MKRIQLFEFEDLGWFPQSIRRSMTNLIAVLHKMVGTKDVIADLIAPVVEEHAAKRIVDLGSGSGGIMPEVLKTLRSEYGLKDVELILTDLYPNQDMVNQWTQAGDQQIAYHPEPIEATDLACAPKGIKTMINCFHHMRPMKAKKILQTAKEEGETIIIYEMGENNLPLVLWWILLPVSLLILVIMVFFMTPWVRPLSWQQLVFTYLIPVIPICYAWDGQVSVPRMYTMKDLDLLLEDLQADNYRWEKGRAYKKNKKKLGTYLIGFPANK